LLVVQEKDRSIAIVAKAVRGLRKKKGWSQEQFAAKCGLHRTYVGWINWPPRLA
jgi:ribosome-binding protein aMBF1 (putative translation factor)